MLDALYSHEAAAVRRDLARPANGPAAVEIRERGHVATTSRGNEALAVPISKHHREEG